MIGLDLRESIVQIHHVARDDIVGAGFVVSDRLVVTCAHVVEAAREKPDDKIKVVFHVNRESRWANVIPEAWRGPEGDDIAILLLDGGLPVQVKALVLSSSIGCEGHPFRSLGYSQVGDVEGLWATGEIQGIVKQSDGRQLLQLASPELDRGISGSPVLDLTRARVVGMVTAVYYPDQTTKFRDTALATLAETIHQTCSEIPLAPVPLRELIGPGYPRLPALMDRRFWAVLGYRLRLLARVRPMLALFLVLGVVLMGLAVAKTADAWLNRNWTPIEGNSALLCTDDWNCSWPTAPFEIQVAEVTNRDYLDCVQSKQCDPPGGAWRLESSGWTFPPELGQHPVFISNWEEAGRYCGFIGARLPTEAEWILAARGGSTRKYPWGDEFDAGKANIFESRKGDTVAVNQDPGASTQPIRHLIGNLREWVDGAVDPHDRSKGFGVPIGKGGSYMDSAAYSTIDTRFQGNQIPYSGVRCARDRR